MEVEATLENNFFNYKFTHHIHDWRTEQSELRVYVVTAPEGTL